MIYSVFYNEWTGEKMSKEEDYLRQLIIPTEKEYYLTCAYARNCLYLLLKALSIGTGDEVIVPAYSCLSIYNAIEEAGATPVYVDCDEGSLNISPEKILLSISPRTKLIYIIHAYGIAAKVDEISYLAESRGIWVTEDISHTLNADYSGRGVGAYGHFTISSLTKLFINFEGAFIATNEKNVFIRMKELQQTFSAPPKGPRYFFYFAYRLLGAWYERDASLAALLLFKLLYILLNIFRIKREASNEFNYEFFHMSRLGIRLFVFGYKKSVHIMKSQDLYSCFIKNGGRFLKFPYRTEKQTRLSPNHLAAFTYTHKKILHLFSLSTWHNTHLPGVYPNADRVYEELRVYPKLFAKVVGYIGNHSNRKKRPGTFT